MSCRRDWNPEHRTRTVKTKWHMENNVADIAQKINLVGRDEFRLHTPLAFARRSTSRCASQLLSTVPKALPD